MADDQQVVRSVSWTEVFSFTHIFKSFRMAIHPGKLILALAAILLCYGLGRIMDCVWSGASDACVVIPNEAQTYWTANGRADFLNRRKAWLAKREDALVGLMTAAEIDKDKAAKAVADDLDDAVDDLEDALKVSVIHNLEDLPVVENEKVIGDLDCFELIEGIKEQHKQMPKGKK